MITGDRLDTFGHRLRLRRLRNPPLAAARVVGCGTFPGSLCTIAAPLKRARGAALLEALDALVIIP